MITPGESRVLDINSEALGVSTASLMENAGKGIADASSLKAAIRVAVTMAKNRKRCSY